MKLRCKAVCNFFFIEDEGITRPANRVTTLFFCCLCSVSLNADCNFAQLFQCTNFLDVKHIDLFVCACKKLTVSVSKKKSPVNDLKPS